MPCQCNILVESELEQLVAKRGLLIGREICPVPRDQLSGLDGGQLAELWLWVPTKDLKEGVERGGGGVVVLVQGRCSSLDTLGIGW